VQLDKNLRPIVPRISSGDPPASAVDEARQVSDEMPERSMLEALANTAKCFRERRECTNYVAFDEIMNRNGGEKRKPDDQVP
jgi:hypothetical protein